MCKAENRGLLVADVQQDVAAQVESLTQDMQQDQGSTEFGRTDVLRVFPPFRKYGPLVNGPIEVAEGQDGSWHGARVI